MEGCLGVIVMRLVAPGEERGQDDDDEACNIRCEVVGSLQMRWSKMNIK